MWDKIKGAFGKKPEVAVRKGIPIAIPDEIANMFNPLPDIEIPEQYQSNVPEQDNADEPCQCEKDFANTGKREECELCGYVSEETNHAERGKRSAATDDYFTVTDDEPDDVEEAVAPRPRRGWIDEDEENL